ncbi:SH3 domain-containing protein [Cucumibacter marinus]|uniref:SH3 domain-containing protein n=1 Tax=Cucumibacter marinus TaxID=1121252 RepID=UPI0003FFD8FB|nr:SH3 domain-containing protein [Cucumibacter marinus]
MHVSVGRFVGALILVWVQLQSGGGNAAEIRVDAGLVDRLAALSGVFDASPAIRDSASEPLDEATGWPVSAISVTGVIEPGDAEKLEAVLADYNQFFAGIVFDSPGGSFVEGIKMGRVIRYALNSQDPNLAGVYVLKGQRCMSACALAFAGSFDVRGDTRYVEQGARLGFHMGQLDAETSRQSAEVGEVLSLAYDIVAEYATILEGGASPVALLQEALKHRDAESFYTLQGDIETLQMGFTPVASDWAAKAWPGEGIDQAVADRICDLVQTTAPGFDLITWEYGRFHSDPDTGFDRFGLPDGNGSFTRRNNGDMSCQLTFQADGTVLVGISETEPPCSVPRQETFDVHWCPTREVTEGTVVTRGLFAEAMGCSRGVLRDAGSRAGTIKTAVNLRDEPGLDGDVVTVLEASEEVELIACRAGPGPEGLWFAVRSGGGEGWVSARFVYEPTYLQPSILRFTLE